ncbi:hypothetical protein FA13DRAFT_914673 [Coprinellus micaceus]|uniref:Uncharacterized protein n=1 Tax=Coprinellus micaceus TaxID=71717 RepID=A0A4Y7TTN4_COPMI|nr:hypothetical protein FA13DRAFT_914673 [Coprinellus micaceus]
MLYLIVQLIQLSYPLGRPGLVIVTFAPSHVESQSHKALYSGSTMEVRHKTGWMFEGYSLRTLRNKDKALDKPSRILESGAWWGHMLYPNAGRVHASPTKNSVVHEKKSSARRWGNRMDRAQALTPGLGRRIQCTRRTRKMSRTAGVGKFYPPISVTYNSPFSCGISDPLCR